MGAGFVSDSYLVFPGVTEANTRNEQLGAALGYPDASGIYKRYTTPDQHPTNGEAALIITTVCSCEVTPYYIRDAAELLTQPERAALKTDEEMQAAGWWPEETP